MKLYVIRVTLIDLKTVTLNANRDVVLQYT